MTFASRSSLDRATQQQRTTRSPFARAPSYRWLPVVIPVLSACGQVDEGWPVSAVWHHYPVCGECPQLIEPGPAYGLGRGGAAYELSDEVEDASLSPDGTRLVLTERRETEANRFVTVTKIISLEDGDTKSVEGLSKAAWASDSEWLAMTGLGRTIMLDRDGKTEHDLPPMRTTRWAADGAAIRVSEGVIYAGSSQVVPWPDDVQGTTDRALGPDGTWVAAVTAWTLVMVRMDGTERTAVPLPGDAATDPWPIWAPDSSAVLVESSLGMVVVERATGAVAELSGDAAAWSPLRPELAVVHGGALAVISTRGEILRHMGADAELDEVVWSEDGAHLLWRSPERCRIFRAEDGTELGEMAARCGMGPGGWLVGRGPGSTPTAQGESLHDFAFARLNEPGRVTLQAKAVEWEWLADEQLVYRDEAAVHVVDLDGAREFAWETPPGRTEIAKRYSTYLEAPF